MHSDTFYQFKILQVHISTSHLNRKTKLMGEDVFEYYIELIYATQSQNNDKTVKRENSSQFQNKMKLTPKSI